MRATNQIALSITIAMIALAINTLTARADTITGLFNTGVTINNSTLATPGDVDAHYTLITSPYDGITDPPAYVASSYPYDPPAADSQYIGPDPNLGQGFLTGTYVYQTTFSLAGFNPSSAVVSGDVFADDDVDIYLNGNYTGYSFFTAFFGYSHFDITSGFISGVNTLEFRVSNSGGGTTTLGVSGLSGTADIVAGVTAPEPASLTLLAITAFPLVGILRRRKNGEM